MKRVNLLWRELQALLNSKPHFSTTLECRVHSIVFVKRRFMSSTKKSQVFKDRVCEFILFIEHALVGIRARNKHVFYLLKSIYDHAIGLPS